MKLIAKTTIEGIPAQAISATFMLKHILHIPLVLKDVEPVSHPISLLSLQSLKDLQITLVSFLKSIMIIMREFKQTNSK
jgi:hypothetical protein